MIYFSIFPRSFPAKTIEKLDLVRVDEISPRFDRHCFKQQQVENNNFGKLILAVLK